MQYLKDEIKSSIISAALDEFEEKGFNDASIRTIARNAGIATGNLYRYFNSKEELFNYIMEPVSERFTGLIFGDFKADANNLPVLADVVDKIMSFYEKDSREFMILLDKSEGSVYQNLKENLIDLIEKRMKEELRSKLKAEGIIIADEFIFHILASMLIEGILRILKQCKGDDRRIRILISQMLALNLNYFEIMKKDPVFSRNLK
ncbi:MAG: TetR/AcrR family transcriptional regulator [Desulfitobacteriaceae bacterium]|nr:TetR/AcrR family transcriptional regulator [Desulfitobacteriaceae bacterium]MDD4346386.1 TetR/AcrR family transcriptional regulator [Desulfitobacteriaceae bacterium]MDD4400939.1 TetR/AcrR family transcriptional regulator [Desulfitobacteriaceae bacterium]